jgi:arabinose-5-phosphate isomerase
MTCVVDAKGKLQGVFTDGDLRRLLSDRDSIRGLKVGEVMKPQYTAIGPEKLAAEAAEIFERKSLGGRLVVVDAAGRLVGALTFHDLLAARVV